MKHEWRKHEKKWYLPKQQPELLQIPPFKFITIEGEGNPNHESFQNYIGALYSLAYPIKMIAKKDHQDYTVYPLEGIWDLKAEAKENYDGTFNKNDLVFKLMIRQPEFISEVFFEEIKNETHNKKPNSLLRQVKFETIEDGRCVQMMHIGSYDQEDESFRQMERFAEEQACPRTFKTHREIYLSDFRKVAPEKLKTVLRFKVE